MEPITLLQLEEFFTAIRSEASWDADGEMIWGYYFVSDSVETLEKAAGAFEERGYDPIGIFEGEDAGTFILEVDRIEAHTPESLFARNAELNAAAAELGVEYDGMDVNPVPTEEELAAAEAELAAMEGGKCSNPKCECEDCDCGDDCRCGEDDAK